MGYFTKDINSVSYISSLATQGLNRCLTLRGIVALAKLLLQRGFTYVMLGQVQSDRIEGEFGMYSQKAGGNYYISIDQVLNGLRLQRLKLYTQL